MVKLLIVRIQFFALACYGFLFVFLLKTENLIAQCTAAGNTAVTHYAANNGARGVMFNVVATNTITVSCFDANLFPGSGQGCEIYYKAGTFVGADSNAAAWTLIGSTTVTSAGTNLPTSLPILADLVIPAGQTYAFYITNSSGNGGTNYTSNAGTVTDILASNADLTIRGGLGKNYPFLTSFKPRQASVTLHYQQGNLLLGSLPVELAEFDLVADNGEVALNWATLTEQNNVFFTIERSANGQDWQIWERVAGAGVSTEPQFYRATDAFPFPDRSYYRLSQTDSDGKNHILSTKMVVLAHTEGDVRVFPNPSYDQLVVQAEAGSSFKIYDLMGRKVAEEQLAEDEGEKKIYWGNLSAGLYHIEVISPQGRKFVLPIIHK